MQHCAGFISAESLYMFRASSAHHQEYQKTSTAAPGTGVIVAGRSSHHHIRDFVPNMVILLMMGAWRPKHVEWLFINKTCTVLHQVGVLFDLWNNGPKYIMTVFVDSNLSMSMPELTPELKFHTHWRRNDVIEECKNRTLISRALLAKRLSLWRLTTHIVVAPHR